MADHKKYLDEITGSPDDLLRRIMEMEDDTGGRLKKIMLKVMKNELTPRQRQIIVLYYFKGLNIIEIGERLDISPQAVSALMTRARARMFRILQYYIL